jgi:hypothetical protein
VNSIEEPYALIAHVRFREGGGSVGCNIAIRLNTSLLDACAAQGKRMKDKQDVIKKQKYFIEDLKQRTNYFLNTVDKKEIETILLSGSVARGDYYPGKFDGMIDLTVMRKSESSVTAEQLFGKNEDPEIPYHCIKRNDVWFAINFSDFVDYKIFQTLNEARKYSLLESIALYDINEAYKKELETIAKIAVIEQKKELAAALGYIEYLLSEYKKDRWYRREAFIQMHENLNTAIKTGTKCLFYINGNYAPAEDRRLYYSYSLDKLPENYSEVVVEMNRQEMDNKEDYFRREKLFNDKMLNYINKFV